jgi:hypothetical protein
MADGDIVLQLRSWRGVPPPQETRALFTKAADIIERQRWAIGDHHSVTADLNARVAVLEAAILAHKNEKYAAGQSAEIAPADQTLYAVIGE